VPRLWEQTVVDHRRAVRDAILEAGAILTTENGLRSLTMSQVAERAGIGRATLYKYFPDIDAVLAAWHERQIGEHAQELHELAHGAGSATERLKKVLTAFGLIYFKHRGSELAALLHAGPKGTRAEEHLLAILQGLVADAVDAGALRADIPVTELAHFALHSMTSATTAPSQAAVHRLVNLTITGLQA
jgi:AcrR family transcriptional regulator